MILRKCAAMSRIRSVSASVGTVEGASFIGVRFFMRSCADPPSVEISGYAAWAFARIPAMSRATGMSAPTISLIFPSLPMMKAVRAEMPFSAR